MTDDQQSLRPGQRVHWCGVPVEVLEFKGLDALIVRTLDGKKTEIARRNDLQFSDWPSTPVFLPSSRRTGSDWDLALARLEMVRPILLANCRADALRRAAYNLGCAPSTIQRWVKRFEETGLLASLLYAGTKDFVTQRLSEEVETVISRQYYEFKWMNAEPDITGFFNVVSKQCEFLGLPCPNRNTVQARVLDIKRRERALSRYEPDHPRLTTVANATGSTKSLTVLSNNVQPMFLVRIGHCKLAINITPGTSTRDNEASCLTLQGDVRNPYMTLCIDSSTSMVAGFAASVSSLNAESVGQCIVQAVSKKEFWLAVRDFDASWPIHGVIRRIHMDATVSSFSEGLALAAEAHDIRVEPLPGHCQDISSYIGADFEAFVETCQHAGGNAGFQAHQQLKYTSEGMPCMTLPELESWFTAYLVFSYHRRAHPGICTVPPNEAYEAMTYGTADQLPIGTAAEVDDLEKFNASFLRQGVDADPEEIIAGAMISMNEIAKCPVQQITSPLDELDAEEIVPFKDIRINTGSYIFNHDLEHLIAREGEGF